MLTFHCIAVFDHKLNGSVYCSSEIELFIFTVIFCLKMQFWFVSSETPVLVLFWLELDRKNT